MNILPVTRLQEIGAAYERAFPAREIIKIDGISLKPFLDKITTAVAIDENLLFDWHEGPMFPITSGDKRQAHIDWARLNCQEAG